MKKQTVVKNTFALSLIAALCFAAPELHAQQITAPPAYKYIDANGVNLMTGKFVLPGLNIAIGGEGSGLARVVNESSDNFSGKIDFGFIARSGEGDNGPGQLTMDVSLAGQVFRFAVGGGNTRASATITGPGPYTQMNGVATLVCTGDYTQRYSGGVCSLTLGDGSVATYGIGSSFLIQSLSKPDGEVQSFTYQAVGLRSVSSSLGWMLKYEVDGSNRINKITAINTAAAYCDPAAVSCGVSGSFPYVTSSTSGGTTTIGRNGTTLVSYTVNGNVTTITSPSGVTKTVTLSSNKVASVSIGGSTWTYTYLTSPVRTRITNPDTTTFEITIGLYGVTREKDEIGAERGRTYDETNGPLSGALLAVGQFGSFVPTTTYGRDARGNITSTSLNPSGGGTPLVTTAVYPTTCVNIKTCNKPTSVTQPNGVTTTYTYDPNHGGLLTETTPAVGGVQSQIRYTYSQYTPYIRNSSGVLVAQQPVWRVSEISRCMSSHLGGCVGTADELRITKGYTSNNLISYTSTAVRGDGSLPQTTTSDIADNGWTTGVDGPRAGTTDKSFSFYDGLGRKVGEISPDPDGGGARPRIAVRYTYDSDGRVYKTENGTAGGTTAADLAAMAVQSYDSSEFSPSNGLPVVARHYEGAALTSLMQNSYDNRFRTVCVAQRLNSAIFGTVTSTPACTRGLVGPDGNDRITKFDYTSTGLVSAVTDSFDTPSARVQYSKTFNDNRTLASVVDAKSNRTAYTYDNFGRPTKTCYATPSNGTITSTTDCAQIAYNPNGTIGGLILRDGQSINVGHDALGRINSKSGAISEIMTYDNFGQVLTHTNNGITESYVYNSLGWLQSDVQPAGTVGYSYDANGRRTQLTYPGGFSVAYAYDELNSLTALTPSAGIGTVSLDYDNYGRRSHIYRGNGQTSTYGYDSMSRLLSLAQGSANTESLGYTQAHQINSKSNSNASFSYALSASPLANYGIDGLNRIASVGTTNIGYDGRGNLASDSLGSYAYNPNNLLTSATQSGVTSTLTYDAADRLSTIAKSGVTTRFLYDGSDLIAEYDGAGNLLRRYVHGARANEPLVWLEGSGTGDVRFFHANDQGSISSVTDAAGTTRSINTYDTYGLRATSNSSYAGRFGFTGQAFLPEIGLYYFKARLYSATFGRFMQTDPIGYSSGVNWYAYTGNDPLNRVDPDGLDSVATIPMGGGIFGMNAGIDVIEVFWRKCGPRCQEALEDARERERIERIAESLKPQGDACNGTLIRWGNNLAGFSADLGEASSKVMMAGLATTAVGAFTLQPEVGAVGIAMTGTGGLGGVGSGIVQFGAGLLQGLGGGGYSNSWHALYTLGAGAVIGRGIKGPTPTGFRSASERAADSLANNTSVVVGGVFNAVTSFLEDLGPQQKSCTR